MTPTVKDIAAAARVSAATVSLVLNGKGGISDDTRHRVLQVAAEMGYVQRTQRAVRSSASARTLRFLKIATHGHTVNRDHSTFISDYIDGMSEQARELGYQLEVVSHEGTPIREIVLTQARAATTGVIVLGTELGPDDLRLLTTSAVPLVVIDTLHDGIECDFVNMDNREAVRKIVGHLVARGFNRIGCIASDVQTLNLQMRREAFIEAMRHHGLEFRSRDVVTVDSTFDGAHADLSARLREGLEVPQAYFCTNDIIAFGCIKALRDFDIRIPDDLSIIGFDNLPMSAAMDPPLTTIDVSKRKIGQMAVRLLDDRIRSSDPQPSMKVLVGSELVVRASVWPSSPMPGQRKVEAESTSTTGGR